MWVFRQDRHRTQGTVPYLPCRGPLPASVWLDTVIRPTAPDMSTIAVTPLMMASPMLKRPCPSAGELMRRKSANGKGTGTVRAARHRPWPTQATAVSYRVTQVVVDVYIV